MNKIFIITVFCILSCASSLNAQTSRQILLRDGLVLRGTDGKLIGPDSNDTWFFELNSSVRDNGFVVEAGTKLELLPSAALERMIADAKINPPAMYQLWNAKVTKYKGKNYIFPSIFIPVNPLAEPKASEKTGDSKPGTAVTPSAEGTGQNSASIDANDSLSLPPEIIKKLNAARDAMAATGQRIPDSNIVTIDTVQQELEKIRKLNPDTVILDKNAILIKQKKEGLEFALDTIGRNIDQTSLRLLPCEVLEQTEARQSSNPDTLRFKISGVVTKYKGDSYLLLYKAGQIYSHGNFEK